MDNLEQYREVARNYRGTMACAAIIGLIDMATEAANKSPLSPVYKALGWQGGTIHQVVREIERLRNIEAKKLLDDEYAEDCQSHETAMAKRLS